MRGYRGRATKVIPSPSTSRVHSADRFASLPLSALVTCRASRGHTGPSSPPGSPVTLRESSSPRAPDPVLARCRTCDLPLAREALALAGGGRRLTWSLCSRSHALR